MRGRKCRASESRTQWHRGGSWLTCSPKSADVLVRWSEWANSCFGSTTVPVERADEEVRAPRIWCNREPLKLEITGALRSESTHCLNNQPLLILANRMKVSGQEKTAMPRFNADEHAIKSECFLCKQFFRFGPSVYLGRRIPDWDIMVCDSCDIGNRDGVMPERRPHLTDHLIVRGIKYQFNRKGWLEFPS